MLHLLTPIFPTFRPLRIVHSTVCARILLNLRKAAAKSTSSGTTLNEQQSTIAFTPDPELPDPVYAEVEDSEHYDC